MRKKILTTIAASALCCAALATTAYADSATVTGSEVNLRTGPGSNYRIVDCLPRGAIVNVTNRSNSAWYEVEYDGSSGFMYAAYLRLSETEETPVTVADEGNGYINAMYVRFRSGPGSGYSILGEYNQGKAVEITGSTGEWTACMIDGRAGYIYSDYINRSSGQSGLTPLAPLGPSDDEYLDGDDEYDIPDEEETGELTPLAPLAPAPTQKPQSTPAPTQKPQSTPTPTIAPVQTESPLTPVESVKGYINGDYVRFRTGPSTNYSIIDSYNRGKAIEITGSTGDWTACVIDGQSGYVYSDYVVREVTAGAPPVSLPAETEAPLAPIAPETDTSSGQSRNGYISGNNVRMRSGPSMSSGILDELFFGNAVTITGTSGDWTAVTYNGQAGYVYSSYVKEGTYSFNDIVSSTEGSAEGRDIVNYALQFVGYNYSWGGKSPSTGFDCSGLVYYVYQHFGYTLNRVAADQAKNGVHVDESELQPGDILCFYSGGSYIGHVGIYMGDGKFVHAANSATGVIVSELSGYYSNRGYEARRIV